MGTDGESERSISMRVGILGRVTVWDDRGDEVALRPQVRRLLGLFVAGGSSLSIDRIAEHASGGRRSGSAARTAVGRLRSVVGDDRIVTVGSGYELVLGPEELDSTTFEQLRSRSNCAEPDDRIELLTAALGQWRGPALGDLADEPWAAPTAARLNRVRADALEDLAEALVGAGRWSEAVVLLEPHIAQVPYQERPVALLMRALAGSGRLTEALRCLRSFRVTLRDDIGVGPSQALMDLEIDLLAEADPQPDDAGDTTRRGRLARATSDVHEPASTFVGRVDEVKQLVEELSSKRLISLTGVGGVGKTRLAMRVAAEVAEQLHERVWFIDLAGVTEVAEVARAAATSLGVTVEPATPSEDSIVDHLRCQRGLVVVDNCEHVLAPAASLANKILIQCPSISIVATSRERLGVDGEQVHPVPGLDGFEAPTLFCARATEADDRFDPSDADRRAIDAICRRLDGLPLAIELAAARTRSLTPTDVLERLDDRFRLLRNRHRSVDRHGTLAAAVDWSYDLLDDDERAVFDRLSVFPGDFNLAAATAVCAPCESSIEVGDVLDSLVDKSLVVADLGGRHVRFRLLETLRAYAGARLGAAQGREVHQRHRDHFASVAFAVREANGPNGFNDMAPFAMVRRDWHNFRAAVAWSLANGEPGSAASIALLPPVFYLFLDEHAAWMNSILDQLPDEHPLASLSCGFAALWCTLRGDNHGAFEFGRRGLELEDHLGGVSHRLLWWAISEARLNAGDPVGGLDAARRSLAAAEPSGQTDAELVSPLTHACISALSAEPDAVQRLADRLAAVAARAPSEVNTAAAANGAGYALLARGDATAALDMFRRNHAVTRGIPHLQGVALKNVAVAASLSTAPQLSTTFAEALGHVSRGRMWSLVWIVVEALAVYWARTGRPLDAAVLIGYLDRHGCANGLLVQARRDAVDGIRRAPGTDAARERGATMSREEVVECAFDGLGGTP